MQNFAHQTCCSTLKAVKRLLRGPRSWCRNFDENVKKIKKMNFRFSVLKSFLMIILSWKKSWEKLKGCFERLHSDEVHKSVKSLKKLNTAKQDWKFKVFTNTQLFREPLGPRLVTALMLSAMKIFWSLYFSIPRAFELFDIMITSY